MSRSKAALVTAAFAGFAAALLVVIDRPGTASARGLAVNSGGQAIGFPSRAPHLDVLPGFIKPPAGYGEVAFFWWLGDPLTKERLLWHLDQLAGRGITGLQINYAHTDKGGVSYGLSMPSDPPLFSPAWWNLVRWFAAEASRRGMSISLSDYTLGLGQGWAMDAAAAERPDLAGALLRQETRAAAGGERIDWVLPAGWLSVTALEGKADKPASSQPLDLAASVRDGRLGWRAPGGDWRIIAVFPQRIVPSLDPTHPDSGPAYIRRFFAPFEKNLPGQAGRALNFFFSDELDFRLPGMIWSDRLAAAFRASKGYDLRPELAGLFVDIGPRTPKLRLDYNDVRVALAEEGFFRPVYEWHQARGMIYGCDHGGRGQDVAEFGDYFRTQRWNQGPGCDQPNLDKNLIKAKVASSIAHLYDRPRVWLEGFHSSGWGTSSADVADAVFADFLMGHNLLSLHGLYYSTHGGWWEWAPPDNHWRMPYWAHLGGFMTAVERLSYLFSQGRHVCDTAILYPVAPVEAGMGGDKAVETAFAAGRGLYANGLDFDFIDFESVLRAEIQGGALKVAGESYRVLILPAMRAVRFGVLEKAAALVEAGGTVIAVGALPEASERAGRNDVGLDGLTAKVFGLTSAQAADLSRPYVRRGERGGLTAVAPAAADAASLVRQAAGADIDFAPPAGGAVYFLHRRAGFRDVYGLYGLAKATSVRFRASGKVELWDPWTGRTESLAVEAQEAGSTTLRLPLEASEIQLIVFSPGRAEIEKAVSTRPARSVDIAGSWTVEMKPTLDNRWGDFRWPPRPALIGPEARRFLYSPATGRDNGLPEATEGASGGHIQAASFGPVFWKLGPLPADGNASELEARLASARLINPAIPIGSGTAARRWEPYEMSWRWGIEDDPGHQGYHGLKENVSDEFIRLGRAVRKATEFAREAEAAGTRYYLWTSVVAPEAMTGRILAGGTKPAAMWLGGKLVADLDAPVDLAPGSSPVLLRYDRPGTGWFLIAKRDFVPPPRPAGDLAMSWYGAKGILPFDVRSDEPRPAGWYRFTAAPGLRAMTVTAIGEVEAWAAGRRLAAGRGKPAADGAVRRRFVLDPPASGEAEIVLRIRHERGRYGGAAMPEPVEFECGEGRMALGDWSGHEGLASFSGGALYRTEFARPVGEDVGSAVLDLGAVASSAEVWINGKSAGVRVAPPWRFEIGPLLRPGGNLLEVLVRNTLANHYASIPTRYRGSTVSGLLGPVRLIIGS